MENDELLHKWVNGELSEEELRVFQQRPEYTTLQKLNQHLDRLQPPQLDESATLDAILQTDKSAPKAIQRRLIPNWLAYGAAAAVLLLVTWFFWPQQANNHYQLAKGERAEGLLPDQSSFVLNADSELDFDAKTWTSQREVQLQGEAFFSVKTGQTFTVQTPYGSVEVLGTRFNVWARDNTLEVSCQHGRVAVKQPNGQLLQELEPGAAVRFTSGQEIETWQNPQRERPGWVEGISHFRKVPLSRILAALERQFDLDIQAGAVDTNTLMTCNFPHKELNLALESVLGPLGVDYETTKNGVVRLMVPQDE